MAMDFFEHQERARKRTGVLVLLFVVAVVATVAVLNVIAAMIFVRSGEQLLPVLGLTTLAVLATIAVGAMVKTAQMASGGRAVAEALGGRLLTPAGADADERRALNVVEEMAIASGLPVPAVYVLQDASINAFAAGRTPQDSVIGLTDGCMRRLTRDELQGVVAHEFSHIFHRDTTLNMRLVGWLGGILALSLIGRAILRGSRYSSRKNNGGPMAVGLALFVVGIVGYFFGRLIQSAVSRQREFLADASAVQYTRNPDGLAGALERISRGVGSQLEAPRTAEFSHFLFAEGLTSMFATHPPIAERVRRIRGLGAAMKEPGAQAPARAVAAPGASDPPRIAPEWSGANAPRVVSAAAVQHAVQHAGEVTPVSLEAAREIIASLPRALVHAAHHPFDARAVVVGLLLSPDPRMQGRQRARIRDADGRLSEALASIEVSLAAVRPWQRLPLLEMCAASLTLLSPQQYHEFKAVLADVVGADDAVDRFEWIVRVVLRRAVEKRGSGGGARVSPTPQDARLVTSVLSYSGARTVAEAEHAWQRASHANPGLQGALVPAKECSLDALDAALGALDMLSPRHKRQVVEGCTAAVCADGRTTPVEAELLRAVCAGMGVPMPPLQADAIEE